jgi:Ser/Thr protein kinase RdoA (MazF antagonist)
MHPDADTPSRRATDPPAPFPVVHSVFSSRALVAEVLPRYDLGPVAQCALLNHSQNDLYLVRAGGDRYLLRISQANATNTPRSRHDVLYELDVLGHLGRKGIPAARPIARRDGQLTTALAAPEGTRQAVLFACAPGEPLDPQHQTAERSHRYGGAVAALHAATDDFRSEHPRAGLDAAALIETPLRLAEPLLAHRPGDWGYLLGLAAMLKDRMTGLEPEGLEVGVCHGDLHGGNAHLTADGTLTLYDFECCAPGWRAYDLAVFRWGVALGRHMLGWSAEQADQYWRAFVRGYRERRVLRDVDLAAIPVLVAVRHFWFIGLRAGNWENWGRGEVDDQAFDWLLAFLRDWESQGLGAG